MTKICYKCGLKKDISEFTKNKTKSDGLSHICKICKRLYDRKYWNKKKDFLRPKNRQGSQVRRDRNGRFLWNYLLKYPCVDCGESNPIVLEFDHVGGSKNKNVSDMARGGYGIGTIKNEIKKCEVRCANCHRIKTSSRGQFHQYIQKKNRD